jgi:phosphodiesterase/alkaline phosphatase D-like protein
MLLAIALAAVVVTTGAPVNVGPATATVTGTVEGATTYRFEYGTSTSYGLQTSDQPVSGAGAVQVHADLAGLTADTTYHYRLVADGTAGADRTFHTARAPAATTGSGRSITATGARLTATVDPNGIATTYHFEYGTTAGYGIRTGEASAGSGQSGRSVSATVGGLRPHVRYHYRVVATNAAGVARGRDRTFTTQRNPRAITASASPNPAPWSGSTTVSGRVTGRGVGGTTVALERQDFPSQARSTSSGPGARRAGAASRSVSGPSGRSRACG